MGITVSVDSWAEQTLQELCEKEYNHDDQIYQRLISSATIASEIYILDSKIFKNLLRAPGNNLKNTLLNCIEGLVLPEPIQRTNSAALLCKLLPFLCHPDSPIKFLEFILGTETIFGQDASPGSFIIEKCLLLLSSISPNSPDLVSEVDSQAPISDLLLLSTCITNHFFKNSSLHHQMLVSVQNDPGKILSVLLNYIYLGGHGTALLALLAFLLFHPISDFQPLISHFMEAGGDLMTSLCQYSAEKNVTLSLLASLGLKKDGNPSLSFTDKNLLRLSLLRYLSNSELLPDLSTIQQINTKFDLPLAKALIYRLESKNEQISSNSLNSSNSHNHNQSPISQNIDIEEENEKQNKNKLETKKYSFEPPLTSEKFYLWSEDAIPSLFLFFDSYLLEETSLNIKLPDFDILDTLVQFLDI